MIILDNSPILLNFGSSGLDLGTKIMAIYEESQNILKNYPELVVAITSDLNDLGLNKKKVRIAEKLYKEEKEADDCEFLFDPSAYEDVDARMVLKIGRPRMPVDLVLFFLLLRGKWGSVTDQEAAERVVDSISVQAILAHHNQKTPGLSTIRENVNSVSNETRQLLLKCQCDYIHKNMLDNFDEVYIDSTHVEANTSFPTDIDILFKIVSRCLNCLTALKEYGIEVDITPWLSTRLEKMERHLKFVNMNAGKGIKGKVKEQYRNFLKLASTEIANMTIERDKLQSAWETVKLGPAKRMSLDSLWDKIEQDLQDAEYVFHYASLRIEKGIITPCREKILSTSDRSAAYIAKGQREPVIGYKPQIARSQNGFIAAILTPIGNAADSEMLKPTVEHVINNTGFVPSLVSADDGYASAAGIKHLHETLGIANVSISGAKGKKLLGEELWNSSIYTKARAKRSAVESGMFVLKFNHHFDSLRRRGIESVEAEMLEKVITYNCIHITRKREELRKKEEEEKRSRKHCENAA